MYGPWILKVTDAPPGPPETRMSPRLCRTCRKLRQSSRRRPGRRGSTCTENPEGLSGQAPSPCNFPTVLIASYWPPSRGPVKGLRHSRREEKRLSSTKPTIVVHEQEK